MTAPPEQSVEALYAPVRGDLDRVEANLLDLAAKADLSLDDRLLAQAVLSGGKKVRPALTLLAAQTGAESADKPVIMATAVELLHIATLIHDDTVDGSRTRRGRATAPSLWGGKAAILLGDFVFAASATYVCDTGDVYVIRRFSETIMELARGELAEHFSAFDWTQTPDDYAKRIYSKTASLFSTAAEAGGVLGGADAAASDALRRYGRAIGMAYQVMDDVLDFLGAEEELGKPVGADLLQGTLTLPTLLFAQARPDEPALRRLRDGGRAEDDLRELTSLVAASDAIDRALDECARYRADALSALDALPPGDARETLAALADYMGVRRS